MTSNRTIATTCLVALSMLAASCGEAPQESAVSQEPDPQTAQGSERSGDIAWLKSFEQAKRKAAQEKKPLLLDFTTDWCRWCRVLEAKTWPDPDVVAASKRYVSVKIDGDTEKAAVAAYGVRGFPTIVLATPEGKAVETIAGFVGPDPMAFKMNAVADGKSPDEALAALLDGGAGTFHERMAAANAAHQKRDTHAIVRLLDPIRGKAPAGKRSSYEEGMRLLAYCHLMHGATDEAQAILKDTLDDPDVQDAQEMRRMLAWIESQSGAAAGAR